MSVYEEMKRKLEADRSRRFAETTKEERELRRAVWTLSVGQRPFPEAYPSLYSDIEDAIYDLNLEKMKKLTRKLKKMWLKGTYNQTTYLNR